MSNLHQWIIVVQIVLSSSGVISAGDDREHVHIKVHIPDLHRKHTHFRKIQKHYFHPKKVVKSPEFLESELDTTPFTMVAYGLSDHGQAMQFPSHPISLPSFPDIPTYGMDNTLEATIMKKPKMSGMHQFMSESMLTKFHGMKKPSEFLGAHPADEIHTYSNARDEEDDGSYADDYDTRSTESMVMDQRVAGSSYPYSLGLSGSFNPKWPSYSNLVVSSMKPYNSGMKYSPPEWLSSTSDDDSSSYENLPSTTTMHITRAKPLSSSRIKFSRDPFSEPWITQKKKKSKTEKRNRIPSSGFRINY